MQGLTFGKQVTSADEVLRCARPLLFENTDDIYSYSTGATCFIIKYLDSAFVVTAKHCLVSQGLEVLPERVLVQYYPGASTFLPLSKLYTCEEEPPEDTDTIDLAVLKIATEQLSSEERHELGGFRINSLTRSYAVADPRSRFLFRGYPFEINQIEYDVNVAIQYDDQYEMSYNEEELNSHIRRRAFAGEGVYVALSPIRLCHTLRFATLPLPINDLNGLSGSPVFQLKRLENGIETINLMGMITNAGSEFAHFLDSTILFKLLSQIK